MLACMGRNAKEIAKSDVHPFKIGGMHFRHTMQENNVIAKGSDNI